MFSVLFLALIILFIHLLFEFVRFIISLSGVKEHVLRTLQTIHYVFTFNFYIRMLFGASLFIFISAFSELFDLTSHRYLTFPLLRNHVYLIHNVSHSSSRQVGSAVVSGLILLFLTR